MFEDVASHHSVTAQIIGSENVLARAWMAQLPAAVCLKGLVKHLLFSLKKLVLSNMFKQPGPHCSHLKEAFC